MPPAQPTLNGVVDGSKFRELREYTVTELAEATGGFNAICLIGEGGFGRVYRAMVQLAPVAIKVLDHEGLQGLREYYNELQLSCSIRHPSVVKLYGYAAEGKTQCLIYELVANGNLEDRLACKASREGYLEDWLAFKEKNGSEALPPLPWPSRIKIAAQSAGALSYLHSRSIFHRDIKPANIFLDCNFNAKLGDIGLAAMDGVYAGASRAGGEAMIGTWAYLAPEYKTQGRSSTKTDVYAFGLSMLQLLTAAAQPRDLIRRCQQALEDCSLAEILDQQAGAWDERMADRLVKLGLWCCMHHPDERPPILSVHNELCRLLQQLQLQGLLPSD